MLLGNRLDSKLVVMPGDPNWSGEYF